MTDLPIRAEAVKAALIAQARSGGPQEKRMRAAIAEFCRVEGLTVERMDFDDPQALPSPTGHSWRQRLVGKWHSTAGDSDDS